MLINLILKWHEKKYRKPARKVLIIVMPFLFFLFMAATLVPAYIFHRKLYLPVGISYPYNAVFGILLIIFGLFIYIWTIILFAGAEGTQLPIAPTQGLVTAGPYTVSRNPMITGAILIFIGLGLIIDSLSFILLGMIVPGLYLIYIKFVEEKELEARFGKEYRYYKKNTPFFVPKISFRRKLR